MRRIRTCDFTVCSILNIKEKVVKLCVYNFKNCLSQFLSPLELAESVFYSGTLFSSLKIPKQKPDFQFTISLYVMKKCSGITQLLEKSDFFFFVYLTVSLQ